MIAHSRFGFVMHRRIEGDSRSPWCSRQAPTEIYLELPRGDR